MAKFFSKRRKRSKAPLKMERSKKPRYANNYNRGKRDASPICCNDYFDNNISDEDIGFNDLINSEYFEIFEQEQNEGEGDFEVESETSCLNPSGFLR